MANALPQLRTLLTTLVVLSTTLNPQFGTLNLRSVPSMGRETKNLADQNKIGRVSKKNPNPSQENWVNLSNQSLRRTIRSRLRLQESKIRANRRRFTIKLGTSVGKRYTNLSKHYSSSPLRGRNDWGPRRRHRNETKSNTSKGDEGEIWNSRKHSSSEEPTKGTARPSMVMKTTYRSVERSNDETKRLGVNKEIKIRKTKLNMSSVLETTKQMQAVLIKPPRIHKHIHYNGMGSKETNHSAGSKQRDCHMFKSTSESTMESKGKCSIVVTLVT